MTIVTAMPVAAAACRVGKPDSELWRILHHYVGDAYAWADQSGVKRVAFDGAPNAGNLCLIVCQSRQVEGFVGHDLMDATAVQKFAAGLFQQACGTF